MNRNTEWESFVSEIKKYLPPQLEDSAQRALLRAKKHTRRAWLIKAPLAGIFVIFVVFAALVNTSSSFVMSMRSIPLLNKLTELMTAKPSLRTTN